MVAQWWRAITGDYGARPTFVGHSSARTATDLALATAEGRG